MADKRMADLKITRIYSKTLQRTRRLFSYEFSSDDNQALLGLAGSGVSLRAVSLADFLYEGDWNKEMRRLISELPKESPVYEAASMLKHMDYNSFRIELYRFLVHAMLILVYDQARGDYALLGDRVWIYDPNHNPVWNNQIWEGFFITKDGDRQYMPPVLESIDPEGLSESTMPMDIPGLSMREAWEELNNPIHWWEPCQPNAYLRTVPSFRGKVTLSVSGKSTYFAPEVLATVTAGEEISYRERRTVLHFGREIVGLRASLSWANTDEAEAACEAFNAADREVTIYWVDANPARLRDGALEVILELSLASASHRPILLQGKISATKEVLPPG